MTPIPTSFIRTGQVDSKFGLDLANGEAMEALRQAKEMDHISVKGLHCHIGSQILEKAPFVHAAEVSCNFLPQCVTSWA